MKTSEVPAKIETGSQTLSYLFDHSLPSEEEINRLNQLIAEKELPREIIFNFAKDTRLFKEEFLIKVRIDGFRVGGKGNNIARLQQQLNALVDFLRKPKHLAYTTCWLIYGQAVGLFVASEMPALKTLLQECTYDEHDIRSEAVLRNICANALEFEVKPEDVRKFYEVTWLERIDNLDELLLLCQKRNESKAQAKKLRQISTEIDALKQSLELIGTKTAKFDQSIERLDSHSKLLTKRLDELKILAESSQKTTSVHFNKIFSSLKLDVDNAMKMTSDIGSKLNKEREADKTQLKSFAKSLEELNSKFEKNELTARSQDEDRIEKLEISVLSELEENRDSVSSVIKRLETLETDLLALVESKDESSVSNLCKQLIEQALSPVIVKQNQIDELTQKLNKTSSSSNSINVESYRSPLTTQSSPAKVPYFVAKEMDFIRYWGQYLRKQNKVLSPEQLIAYHCAFLANSVIVADFELASSWCHCLGWDRFTMDLVASPAWSSELDWQDGALHLFGNSHDARILNLHNYDAGLVDCYLSPSVHLWAIKQNKIAKLRKLFLIPSDAEDVESSDILNHSAVIPNEIADWTNYRLSIDVGRDFPKNGLQSCSVDPAVVTQWMAVSNSLEQVFERLETAIREEHKIKLNSWTRRMCIKTMSECERFFDESSAVSIAVAIHVLPWVKGKGDESDYELLKLFTPVFLGLKK